MTAKEFLLSVQRAERELKLIADKRRHYEDLINSIGSHMSMAVVQRSGNSSKTEAAAVGLVDFTASLVKKEQEYVALIKKAEALIDKLEQEKFKAVLTKRYLCSKSWKTIRDEMDYKDEKSVFRCHGYALRELQKVM